MEPENYIPSAILRPYVKKIVVQETALAQTYTILPDTSLVMGFQYKGRLSYLDKDKENALAASGITGLRNTFRCFKNSADIGTVLVVFHEMGAYPFFRLPLNELFGASLPLDNLMQSSTIAEVEDQLKNALTHKQRVDIVEQFLISRLDPRIPDLLVLTALQHIYQSKGDIRITDLAGKLNISQSPLEKRFRKVVGASPKKFASIVRINHVIGMLSKYSSLTHIGYEAGYFDQAHFIKDFKSFTGSTPDQFLHPTK